MWLVKGVRQSLLTRCFLPEHSHRWGASIFELAGSHGPNKPAEKGSGDNQAGEYENDENRHVQPEVENGVEGPGSSRLFRAATPVAAQAKTTTLTELNGIRTAQMIGDKIPAAAMVIPATL